MTSSPHRPAREPVFNLPGSVLAAVLILVGVHAVRSWGLSEFTDFRMLIDWAVVPARWSVAFGGATSESVLAAIGQGPEGAPTLEGELARYVLAEEGGRLWTGLTYALLHGSWGHVLMNSVWLAAFGTPVARRCGPARFALLAGATALGGAVAHALVHPMSALPMVGASAAVSGMMAAAIWFIFSPPSWLLEGRLAEPHERRRESLAGLVRNQRAVVFFAVWLATNYLSAVLAGPLGITDASIAWEAHLGGFVIGLALFPLIDPRDRRSISAAA
ncbi:MAG TPA: rhomboid family intramembrane serine protease [Microvirga sp.]|jgi:membrane associated rhomboid family serine protease|nr:rhomboid family intramembrane serine protease [Microvirga sp.]